MILDVYCKECDEINSVDFGDAIYENSSESGEVDFCCEECGARNLFYLSINAKSISDNKD